MSPARSPAQPCAGASPRRDPSPRCSWRWGLTAVPRVLFVCVHNAGRSQMAAGFLRHLVGDQVDIYSAGSEPADRINPVAVEAMAEKGIDISANQPKLLEDSTVAQADFVITMGCGDACPIYPGKRYEDWQLEDPAGKPLEGVRPIRDEIERRVRALVGQLGPTGGTARP